MHANNEVGAVQDVAALAAAARAAAPGALVHTDAAQSAAALDVTAAALGVDMLTLVGHKIGAPKGVGALFLAPRARAGGEGAAPLLPQLRGGGQERGVRAGTEALAQCVALGAACALARAERAPRAAHASACVARLRDAVVGAFGEGDVVVHGPRDAARRLPHVLSIAVRGAIGARALASLGERADGAAPVCFSVGAACHAGCRG